MIVLKPSRTHNVGLDFIDVYTKVWKTTVLPSRTDPRRVLTLRASQMPFCPVSFFVQLANSGLYRQLDMAGGYYTSVGTTVHEVMQRYLGTSKRFLADWRCPECGKWRRASHEPYCCDTLSEYHEVLIDYKGLVGHIDGIFRDKQGNYWILDFKTTSTAASKKKKNDPGVAYIEQIESYAYALKYQYGITVKGVILAFVIRDNPAKPVMWAKTVDISDISDIKRRIKTYRRQHAHVIDLETKTEALALLEYGKCNNPHCEVCSKGRKEMKQLVLRGYKVAKANNRLPIRAMAERELRRLDKQKKASKS